MTRQSRFTGLFYHGLEYNLGVSYPWFLAWPLFFALAIGQLGRVSVGASGPIALDAALAWYVVAGLTLIVASRRPVTFSRPALWLVGFTLWAGASWLMHAPLIGHEAATAFFYLARLIAVTLALVITPTLFAPTIERFGRQLYLTGLVLVVLGYGQLLIFPNFGFMARFGWDPHVGRMLSTFFDPNYFGLALVWLASFTLAGLIVAPSRPLFIVLGPIVIALVTTFSRSSYLALLVAGIIILGLRSWRLLLAAGVIAAIIITQVPRVHDRVVGALYLDTTAQDRLQSWGESLVIFQENWLTGVGYNAFGRAAVDANFRDDTTGRASHGSDSSLLLVAATTGIVGVVFYLGWLFFTLWQAIDLLRTTRTPFARTLAMGTIGALPAYIVHAQFVNSLFYPLLIVPFVLVVSLMGPLYNTAVRR